MPEAYQKLNKKPLTIAKVQTTLQKTWNNLPQNTVAKAVQNFRKHLQARVDKTGGHSEYSV